MEPATPPSRSEPTTVVVQPQPPAPTLVQAGGRVAENIVSGFANTPTLLLIVILNVAMIVAAAYYLAAQETNRINTANQITELLRLCIDPNARTDHQ